LRTNNLRPVLKGSLLTPSRTTDSELAEPGASAFLAQLTRSNCRFVRLSTIRTETVFVNDRLELHLVGGGDHRRPPRCASQ
jgi:hypothetical protein